MLSGEIWWWHCYYCGISIIIKCCWCWSFLQHIAGRLLIWRVVPTITMLSTTATLVFFSLLAKSFTSLFCILFGDVVILVSLDCHTFSSSIGDGHQWQTHWWEWELCFWNHKDHGSVALHPHYHGYLLTCYHLLSLLLQMIFLPHHPPTNLDLCYQPLNHIPPPHLVVLLHRTVSYLLIVCDPPKCLFSLLHVCPWPWCSLPRPRLLMIMPTPS